MNCSSCGAALPANSTVCQYCHAHNAIDLRGVVEFSISQEAAERDCPCCHIPMQTLNIAVSQPLTVDRCTVCTGLFFPLGGVQLLLDQVVGQVYSANHELLEHLQRELFRLEKVVYRKCPVCAQLMNRQTFGYRSGVVLDRCAYHGDWLDGGEFLHLAQWKKAGGQLLSPQA